MILQGIRVLDFTQYLAGPTVTRLMAEMGADIIKVERSPGGDPSRELPAVKDRRSGYFVQQNLGKRSLCLDLKHADSDRVVRELVAKVDVVVENYGPGVMEKRGWDYPQPEENKSAFGHGLDIGLWSQQPLVAQNRFRLDRASVCWRDARHGSKGGRSASCWHGHGGCQRRRARVFVHWLRVISS